MSDEIGYSGSWSAFIVILTLMFLSGTLFGATLTLLALLH